MLARNANEAFGLGVHIPHEVSQVLVAAHLGDDTVEFQVRLRTVGLFLNRLSAQYQTLLMNHTPAVEHVEVAPLGPRRWRLTLLDADPLGTLPRRLYVDVDGP
mgnify:CR=1 FL=1